MLGFMKKNYDVILLSMVGTVGMFYLVRFLHLFFGYFFIVIAVYILLFIIAMGIALRYKGAKPAWFVIVSFVFGMTGHLAYYKYTCGPNPKDVAVMKPMAEAINDSIVKHGVPESLADIPGLLYELEGCNKEEYYQNYRSYEHIKKEEATLKQTEEKCYFKNITLEFEFTTKLSTSEIGGMLKMISNNKTVLDQFFNNNNTNREFRFQKIDIGSSKTSGICNPMRM